jgi:hypothetical protein
VPVDVVAWRSRPCEPVLHLLLPVAVERHAAKRLTSRAGCVLREFEREATVRVV